ncbi:MAG: tetratricopeptide repeat protein [Desulfitobacterium hafniense]|nr:tetratricopeptide repeat protein [Desulfitobacterium hafniense]
MDALEKLLANGELEKAERYLLDYLDNKPDAAGYNKLGLVYVNLQNGVKAQECFNKALELNPTFVNALNNLGNLARQTGNFEEAVRYYEKAIEIDSGISGIHKNLAGVYKQLKRYQDYKREKEIVKNLGGNKSPLIEVKELFSDLFRLIKG